jgi:hypothetical protein
VELLVWNLEVDSWVAISAEVPYASLVFAGISAMLAYGHGSSLVIGVNFMVFPAICN